MSPLYKRSPGQYSHVPPFGHYKTYRTALGGGYSETPSGSGKDFGGSRERASMGRSERHYGVLWNFSSIKPLCVGCFFEVTIKTRSHPPNKIHGLSVIVFIKDVPFPEDDVNLV